MDQLFTKIAARIASWAGQPLSFIIAFLTIVIWGASGPLFGFSDTWQLVVNTSTTIVTFLMVFLIQNAQNRDGSAIQAKLDEIIRSSRARNLFIGIEHLTEGELVALRSKLEELTGDELAHHRSIERLIARR